VIPWLSATDPFPPLTSALTEPDGLLAAGGDLSAERLLAAYCQPILWWSPNPRMVLFTDEFTMSRSLVRRVRERRYEIRIDTAFSEVMQGCAAPRGGQRGTWITAAMIDAYAELHRRGYAHSVESWRDGELVGGLYGLALGKVFFGESMFARATDASKVALVALVEHLRRLGVPLIDCQQETAHLKSLGARPIARAAFAGLLDELIHSSTPPAGWAPGATGGPDPR